MVSSAGSESFDRFDKFFTPTMKHKRAGRAPRRPMSGLVNPVKPQTPATQPSIPSSESSTLPHPPTTFTPFLHLPVDIRLLVYEQYFTDDGENRIAPKGHPRTRHFTALLLVSHQLYDEALPILYGDATFTINLHPRLHRATKDYVHWLSHNLDADFLPGCNFAGDVAQLANFKHFRLELPARPQKSFKRYLRFDGGQVTESSDCWWQHVVPLCWTTDDYLRFDPGDSIDWKSGNGWAIKNSKTSLALNIGDIISMPRAAGQLTFALAASPATSNVRGWREKVDQSQPSGTTMSAPTLLLHSRNEVREVAALRHLIREVGRLSDQDGSEIRLENSDRSKSALVTSDQYANLVATARDIVGESEAQDVWLVVTPEDNKR